MCFAYRKTQVYTTITHDNYGLTHRGRALRFPWTIVVGRNWTVEIKLVNCSSGIPMVLLISAW